MRWACALLVLACLALPLQPAVAQDRTPTPSARELWESYPLEPSPTRDTEPTAVSSPAGAASERTPARGEGGAPILLLAVLAFAAALGAAALPGLRRRGAGPPAAEPSAGRANGSPPHPVPAARGRNGDGRPEAVVPPDVYRPWIATIEWRHAGGEPRFCALARGDGGKPEAVLADSGPLDWPPKGPEAVQALTEAAETLEAALLAAGWKALPPGKEWYAKRFSWEPVRGQPEHRPRTHTRAGVFRFAAAGGAAVAGGAAIGARSGDGILLAAPSPETDARILNFFLLLEYVQEAFYREALRRTRLTGDLEAFARAAGRQESEHVAFLTERLSGRARARPRADFGDALSTPERFRAAAIDLEETAIAAYIGQGANLTRGTVGAVGTLLSVEARQAAWVLDIAGESPAPRAADPARKPDEVLAALRRRGFIT